MSSSQDPIRPVLSSRPSGGDISSRDPSRRVHFPPDNVSVKPYDPSEPSSRIRSLREDEAAERRQVMLDGKTKLGTRKKVSDKIRRAVRRVIHSLRLRKGKGEGVNLDSDTWVPKDGEAIREGSMIQDGNGIELMVLNVVVNRRGITVRVLVPARLRILVLDGELPE